MKRMWNRTKKPTQEWNGWEEEYDWEQGAGEGDCAETADEIHSPEMFSEDDYSEGAYDEELYAAEDDGCDERETAYFAEDESGFGDYADDAYEYEEAVSEDGFFGAALSHTGELEQIPEEDGYEYDATAREMDGAYEDEEDWTDEGKPGGRGEKPGFWVKLQKGLAGMTAMDKVILGTGAGVLILALAIGCVFAGVRASEHKSVSLAGVGAQLEGIAVIGETGLLAVADAQLAKLAANVADEEEMPAYDEQEYQKEVTVAMEMISIQRDLKIKFVNKGTDRLISNVPFAVKVTDPDGGAAVWSDDDMDGIIYKTEIKPGKYKVVMEPLTDERYTGYVFDTASAEKVEVRKDIAYQAVDVTNEVKNEKEVNAKAEDTKVNETQVESVLQDTVEWVESTAVGSSYNEVAKSSILDPMTLALSKAFRRASVTDGNLNTAAPQDSASPPADSGQPSAAPSEAPSQSPTETPTQSPSETPTEEPSQSPAATPTQSPAPTTYPDAKLTLTPGAVSVTINGTETAAAAAPGVPEAARESVSYEISKAPDEKKATASIDRKTGAITIKGVAAGETSLGVKVAYTAENGTQVVSTEATLKITVVARLITLDKTAVTVYLGEPVTVKAAIAGVADPAVTVDTSDANVAVVKAEKGVITVTGVKAGTATITVGYTENGAASPNVTFAVTVKNNPKADKTTKLKDSGGRQVFVNENGTFREAVYADYYTAAKFYLQGGIKYTGWQTLDGKVYYFRADGTKVTGEQVIQGAKYTFASDGSLVVGDGRLGIDVSKWNGAIDWNAVKNSGVNYVIIRSGYRGSSAGSLIEDPKFVTNIKGATAAGLKVGVYFFTQAVNEVEAVEEASMVLSQVKNYTISYPIFLDVEASGGRADAIDKATRTAVCRAFCQTIQNGGYTAGIYANKTWLNSKIDAGALSAYKIWLAQYASTPTYAGRYDMWQYRSTGRVSGISGDVDMNLSYLGY